MHPEITGRLNNQESSPDLYHSISNYWVTHVINMYIEIWRRPRAIFGLQVGQGQHEGVGGSDEIWNRETMFSQLAKRSIRGIVSGLPRRRYVFS